MRTPLFSLLLLTGCPNGPTTTDAPQPTDPPQLPTSAELPDAAEVDLRGSCPLDERVGGIVLEGYESYTILQGQVNDAVLPINVLEETQTAGDCGLLRRDNPACNPTCQAGFTCDFDGQCIPLPVSVNLGTLNVEGLGSEPRSIEPVQPGNTYFVPNLDHPAFVANQVVRIGFTTEGTEHQLTAVGVEALVMASPELTIIDGQDLTLNWTPPPTPGRGEVALDFTVDQHGNSPLALRCVFPDTGTGIIPSTLIDAMLGAGVSGYPNGRLLRRTVDRVQLAPGCADFTISSPVTLEISVDGVIPCETTEQCPDDQVCNPVTFICEA